MHLASALVLGVCGWITGCGDQGSDDSASAPEPATEIVEDNQAQVSTNEPAEAYALGQPRDDIENFVGVYGDPSNPGRSFFVAPASYPEGTDKEIPPGYLMIGAMWGDVAPWYMKSTAANGFEQQWVGPHADPVKVEFELGTEGQASALKFLTVFDAMGRMERLGDLPEGWR